MSTILKLKKMEKLLHSKVKFLFLIFFVISLPGYSGTGTRSGNIKKENKQEFRSMKGACNCYKQTPTKALKKFWKYQKKTNR